MRIFNKKSKSERQVAPQYTAYQRRAMALAGTVPTTIPYSTYDQMEKDAMIQTALTIKKLAVLSSSYRIEPANGSKRAIRNAEFISRCFERMDGSPRSIIDQAMDSFAKGWSVQEMVFEPESQQIVLKAVRPKDPSLFGLDLDSYGTITALHLNLPGEPETVLPKEKFIIHRNRSNYSRPKGLSDLDAAYRHYQAKQSLLSAWKVHLERFASPTVLGKYERGLPPDEQTSIMTALGNLQDNTAILFPNEIEIGTLGGQREGSGSFLDAIEYHNREIARSILGQTLTTDEGRRVGSLALGKVHLQVLLLQVSALRQELADSVMTEQVIRPLVEMNFGPGDVPQFLFDQVELEAFSSGKLA